MIGIIIWILISILSTSEELGNRGPEAYLKNIAEE
jgi:hypothetical protein